MTATKSTISDALKRSLVFPDASVSSKQLSVDDSANGFTGHAFVIANIGFLLPATNIDEVTGDLRYCQLPHAVRWFWGMTNVRGNLLPVFDFSDLFGFGQSDRNNNHVIILTTGDESFGVVIADVPARIDLTVENELGSAPPLPKPLQHFVRKSYSKDSRIWIDWGIEDFMLSIAA